MKIIMHRFLNYFYFHLKLILLKVITYLLQNVPFKYFMKYLVLVDKYDFLRQYVVVKFVNFE